MSGGDPGSCPICGVAHTACTADSGPITQRLLPQRDAAAREVPFALTAEPDSPPATFGDGTDGQSFSTATYRGPKKKRPSSRS